MLKRVSVGLVGCGAIAQMMYLPNLFELRDRFDVRAVCDVSPQLVESVREQYSVSRAFAAVDDLLAEKLDAVIILTPYHRDHVLSALRAGKHVFVEKPLCYTAEDADAIVRLSEQTRLSVMVGYMKRYDAGYRYGVELISRMSDVNMIRVHNFPHANDLVVSDAYRIRKFADAPSSALEGTDRAIAADLASSVGGASRESQAAYAMLLSVASHDANALRGAFGNPNRVLFTTVWNGGSSVLSCLEYPNDVRCAFEVSRSTRKWFDEELTVYGLTQTVSICFPSPFLMHAPTVVSVRNMDGSVIAEHRYVASYQQSFRRELEEFHRCVADGEPPFTSARDAGEDIRLLREIVRGGPASVPEKEVVR